RLRGHPGRAALFARDVFPELEALGPAQRAGRDCARALARGDSPAAGRGDDVDTAEDVARLT
ncbi:nucleotidyltransferase family protein, partial [Myxococcus sp. 1LA]